MTVQLIVDRSIHLNGSRHAGWLAGWLWCGVSGCRCKCKQMIALIGRDVCFGNGWPLSGDG